MQNKPNVKNAQINVSSLITMNYKNFIPLAGYKNKPNSNLALSAVEWANSNLALSIAEWANLVRRRRIAERPKSLAKKSGHTSRFKPRDDPFFGEHCKK